MEIQCGRCQSRFESEKAKKPGTDMITCPMCGFEPKKEIQESKNTKKVLND